MKSHVLIFKYGHFYIKETGERIQLNDGGEFMIGSLEGNFQKTKPPGNDVSTSQKHHQKRERILEEINSNNPRDLKRISSKGDHLYFEINCNVPDTPLQGR